MVPKYKGIFLWDDRGRKRTGLPVKDGEQLEKLEQELQIKEELQHIFDTTQETGRESVELPLLSPTDAEGLACKPLIHEMDSDRSLKGDVFADKRVPFHVWSHHEDGGVALILDMPEEVGEPLLNEQLFRCTYVLMALCWYETGCTLCDIHPHPIQ
jgi:hypothetical protein